MTMVSFFFQVNDLIQLFVRKPLSEITSQNLPDKGGSEDLRKNKKLETVAEVHDAVSEHMKLHEDVDCRDENTGAWFEAKVERITRNDENPGFDKLTYHVR